MLHEARVTLARGAVASSHRAAPASLDPSQRRFSGPLELDRPYPPLLLRPTLHSSLCYSKTRSSTSKR